MNIGQHCGERIELVIGIPCPSCGRKNGHDSWCTWALLQINLQMRAMISYDGGDTSGCDEMIAHLNEVYAIEQRNRRRMQKKVEREEERDEKVGYLSFRTEEDFLAFGFKPTFTRFR